MSVAIIPFKMPEPMAIPVHIVSMLRGLSGDEAVTGKDGRSLGVLTLIRPADTGPLNHDQLNITEGICRELSAILDR